MTDDPNYEWLRKAHALLTAWNESNQLATDTAVQFAQEHVEHPADIEGALTSMWEMVYGLLGLSGRLLLELSHHTKLPNDRLLEIIGQRLAEDT